MTIHFRQSVPATSSARFTRGCAKALIVGTPAEQLVEAKKPKVAGLSHEEISRMEKEMESLERDYRAHQEQFGENSLTSTPSSAT